MRSKLRHSLKAVVEKTLASPFGSTIVFAFSIITLSLIIWSFTKGIQEPYDGLINVSPSGKIIQIEDTNSSDKRFAEGEYILEIDGRKFSQGVYYYQNKNVGDLIVFKITDNGVITDATVTLTKAPGIEKIRRSIPIIVAFVFWFIGSAFQAFKRSQGDGNIFFYLSLSSANLLAVGQASLLIPPWASYLLIFLLWVLGPLAVHFHLFFPQSAFPKLWKTILGTVYSMAIIGTAANIYIVANYPTLGRITEIIYSCRSIFLAINLLLVVGILVYTYSNATTVGAKANIRIIVLGVMLGIMPLTVFTLIPDAILKSPFIPASYTILFLSFLPMTYGYAIFRQRLMEFDKYVNRSAASILVYSIIGGLYLVVDNIIPDVILKQPLVSTMIILVLVGVFVPLNTYMKRFVDRIFYGGWYDYRFAVNNITKDIWRISDLRGLADTIGSRLLDTLQVERIFVFLSRFPDDNTDLLIFSSEIGTTGALEEIKLSENPSLFDYLKLRNRQSFPLIELIGNGIDEMTLATNINTEQDYTWINIPGNKAMVGSIGLGPKLGGDVFSNEDHEILNIVTRHLGTQIDNIHLLTELKDYAQNLEREVNRRTRELYAAKDRVETILKSVGDGVVVVDLAGKISAVNRALEQQTGYSSSELLRKDINIILSGDSEELIINDLKKTLSDGRIWRGEILNSRKDGSRYYSQLTFAPIRDRRGEIVGYVGSQRDITKTKELDQMKEKFIYDVSHELRTPITNIGLYLDLLRIGSPSKREEYIDVLKLEVDNFKQLVDDVLDLSRMDIGRTQPMSFSYVDMNLIIEQVITAHEPLAENNGLELDFIADAEIPSLLGEPNQLARLIANLISNAIRYTEEGWVKVSTYAIDNEIYIEVRDSGMGIDQEDIPHLFERFYRGKKASQTKIPGTGLGLAIAKEVVDMHRGRIEVFSNVNKGSRFIITLPINRSLSLPHEFTSADELLFGKVVY